MNKIVVLFRHGDYDEKGQLSNEGKKIVFDSLRKLSEIIFCKKIFILTSKAERALQTTDLIAVYFDCEYEELQILVSEGELGVPAQPSLLPNIVNNLFNEYEVVVIVSHEEPLYYLCKFYSQMIDRKFDTKYDLERGHYDIFWL